MLTLVSGDVQNFVGIHPSHPDDEEKLEGRCHIVRTRCAHVEPFLDYQSSMLREFSHFHPSIIPIIE